MSFFNDNNVKTAEQVKHQLKEEDLKNIILHNDDYNTFDHVIDCLIEICKHEPEQAEQCALLTHYKGKSYVKTGTIDELEPIHSQLLEKGLSTEIK